MRFLGWFLALETYGDCHTLQYTACTSAWDMLSILTIWPDHHVPMYPMSPHRICLLNLRRNNLPQSSFHNGLITTCTFLNHWYFCSSIWEFAIDWCVLIKNEILGQSFNIHCKQNWKCSCCTKWSHSSNKINTLSPDILSFPCSPLLDSFLRSLHNWYSWLLDCEILLDLLCLFMSLLQYKSLSFVFLYLFASGETSSSDELSSLFDSISPMLCPSSISMVTWLVSLFDLSNLLLPLWFSLLIDISDGILPAVFLSWLVIVPVEDRAPIKLWLDNE